MDARPPRLRRHLAVALTVKMALLGLLWSLFFHTPDKHLTAGDVLAHAAAAPTLAGARP
jgi:hypothetical protein